MWKNMQLFIFSPLYSVRFTSKVVRKKNGRRWWKKVKFQCVRRVCNRRTWRNWFVLHAKRGMEKEMDSIRWKKDPSKPSHLRLSSPFCSFSSDDEKYLTYRVVVGKSRVLAKSIHACSLREPNAKRKKTRWKRTPCKRRQSKFAG